MISALALGPLPELVESEMGGKTLHRVFQAAGLTSELLYVREGYLPQPAFVRFFHEFARHAGEQWVLGPWINAIQIRDYGLWGEWVLSGPTLRDGLLRGCASIHLHGTHDDLFLATRHGSAEFCYRFAESTKQGYSELAIGGAAALVSFCRAYLGPTWVPKQIGLNIPNLTRRDIDRLATWFGCSVGRSESVIRLVFDEKLLDTPGKGRIPRPITYEDILRERSGTRPATLQAQVQSIVRRNLSEGLTSIEVTARSLDIAVRTLQQRLHLNGDNYRDIVKRVRVDRARELLRDGALSVTEVAHELGYEHAPHFTRMFSAEVGESPSGYAKRRRAE